MERGEKIMSRVLRYAVVGISGVVVNMLVFYLLREGVQLTLLVSSVIAVEAAIMNNFIWNDIWTFKSISEKQEGGPCRFQRFLRFNLVSFTGLVMHTLIVYLLVSHGKVNESFAMLLAIAVVFILNYLLNVKFSWQGSPGYSS